jgi:hypothetical protein
VTLDITIPLVLRYARPNKRYHTKEVVVNSVKVEIVNVAPDYPQDSKIYFCFLVFGNPIPKEPPEPEDMLLEGRWRGMVQKHR